MIARNRKRVIVNPYFHHIRIAMGIPNTDSETDPGLDRPINIKYFIHNIYFKHISRPYLFLNYGNKNTLRCGLSEKKTVSKDWYR